VQDAALRAWAAAGHELVEIITETASDPSEPETRRVLGPLLDYLAGAEADALVVTTTDRLAPTAAVHRLDYYAAQEGTHLLILDQSAESPHEGQWQVDELLAVAVRGAKEADAAVLGTYTRVATGAARRLRPAWVPLRHASGRPGGRRPARAPGRLLGWT
jgi:hypothetical protein